MTADRTRPGELVACGVALVLPTLSTWVYFVLMSGREELEIAYILGKLTQFAFPVLWVRFATGVWPVPAVPSAQGLGVGLAFGAVVAVAVVGLYGGYLAPSGLLAAAPAELAAKLGPMGLLSPIGFLAVAVFYSLFHSLLEEYYWRWFVFGRLRGAIPVAAAGIVSSLGFMSHHVILVHRFLAGAPAFVVLFSGAVAVGGCFWAWLYHRSGSLLGPWLSHLVVDAALMWVGFELLFGA